MKLRESRSRRRGTTQPTPLTFDGHPSIEAVPRPETPIEQVAHWISQACSPPIVALLAFILTVIGLSVSRGWLWIGLYTFLGVIGPLLFLVWQVHRGQVTDLDVHFRQQRKWAFLVTIVSLLLLWAIMVLSGAPALLLLMVSTGLVQWIAIYLITLRWKISVHSTSISGVALFMLWVFGLPATPVVLAVPLVGWSRVKLRRHTPTQVVAGALLGFASFGLALILSPAVKKPGLFGP